MAMSDSKFVELCIPDSLRLAKHQDAALVNEAIATTLIAYRKAIRDNVWEKNQASDIARAIAGFMESAYVPHISQEEEDWTLLQKKAEEAQVMKASAAELAAKPVEAMPETVKSVEPAMPVEAMVEDDNLVAINSVRKVKDANGHDFGWELSYGGAASGKGTVSYARSILGENVFLCELMDSSGNVIAEKYSPVSASSALKSAFKKAGYKISNLAKFAEKAEGKSAPIVPMTVEEQLARLR